MRLHDLRPAEGSHTPRTRVGRGIAAGKGKTAGRGTKGQKARAGGSIPPWFEGGQTPLHMRIPKLRGFKNRFRIEYEVVNIGAIGAAVERGALETAGGDGTPSRGKAKATAQITVNQDILRAVGLVRTLDKPLKILGGGELSAALFVVADAFTASARSKIEAAGGTVSVLEIPTKPLKAIGVETADTAEPAGPAAEPEAAEPEAETAPERVPAEDAPAKRPARKSKAAAAEAADTAVADEATPSEAAADDTADPARSDEAEAGAEATSGDDA
jgi:large subunit ribosomal protein L15